MIAVRAAVPGDGARILEATQALATFHRNPKGVSATAADFEAALFGPHPIIGALIAEDEDALAGVVVWHRSFSTNAGREIMYLEDICVLPAFRGKGAGRALMQATARVAVERGYNAIFWLAMHWNDNALAFYKSCGAVIEEEHFVCRIKGDALRALAS